MIEILIVDDHKVIGEGTRSLLSNEPDFMADFIACSVEVIQRVKEKTYDIYIIDLNMPNKNGLELTTEILKIHQDAKVLIFTGHDIFIHFNYFVDKGAFGFISKCSSKEQLVRSIRCAIDDQVVVPSRLLKQLYKSENLITADDGREISLSQTEEDVLMQVSEGKTNKQIADDLYMSQRNVEHSLTNVYKKFKVNSRTEAVVVAQKLGLIPEVVF